MKSPASSSATAESSMGDNTSDNRRRSPKPTSLTTDEGDEFDAEHGGDPAVWVSFTQNFHQVQSVLDRNRVLIQQVNDNHQSKMHDNMVKNVALIQEINGNISKVVSMYSNMSANFSNVCLQQRDSKGNSEEKQ